jgi:hypothetical protein
MCIYHPLLYFSTNYVKSPGFRIKLLELSIPSPQNHNVTGEQVTSNPSNNATAMEIKRRGKPALVPRVGLKFEHRGGMIRPSGKASMRSAAPVHLHLLASPGPEPYRKDYTVLWIGLCCVLTGIHTLDSESVR